MSKASYVERVNELTYEEKEQALRWFLYRYAPGDGKLQEALPQVWGKLTDRTPQVTFTRTSQAEPRARWCDVCNAPHTMDLSCPRERETATGPGELVKGCTWCGHEHPRTSVTCEQGCGDFCASLWEKEEEGSCWTRHLDDNPSHWSRSHNLAGRRGKDFPLPPAWKELDKRDKIG